MCELSGTTNADQRQESFWGMVDIAVQQLTVGLVQQALELIRTDQLQAAWHQRHDQRRGRRNGYYQRRLATPHGPLTIKVPRCRQGGLDTSGLFGRYQRRIADVDRVLRHAYLLGTSTRATTELAEQVFGGSISHQTVSRLMRWLDQQLLDWRKQPIAPEYKVVYVDGMHLNVLGGDRMVMLVAGQREPEGQIEILDFCVSTGERCTALIQSLRDRGLESVELIVSDESGAIRSALETVYPDVPWQSCSFHRLKGLRDRIGPTDFRAAMTAEAGAVYRRPSKLAAAEAARTWADKWRPQAPAAVAWFLDGLTDSLMFYTLPETWWKRARTNNPMERFIETLRMRLNPMGCFHDEPAIERAVFGQLLRWRKIETTHNS